MRTSSQFRHLVDDGAVFFINGTEISRFNLPGGDLSPTIRPSPTVRNAEPSSMLDIDRELLQLGTNVISVQSPQFKQYRQRYRIWDGARAR